MLSNWVSFLAYPNLFGIKDFVVVVVPDSLMNGTDIMDKLSNMFPIFMHSQSLLTFQGLCLLYMRIF
jgi:hypothetical protein